MEAPALEVTAPAVTWSRMLASLPCPGEFGAGAVQFGEGAGEFGFGVLGACPQFGAGVGERGDLVLVGLAEQVTLAGGVLADLFGVLAGRSDGAVEFRGSGVGGLPGTCCFLLGGAGAGIGLGTLTADLGDDAVAVLLSGAHSLVRGVPG